MNTGASFKKSPLKFFLCNHGCDRHVLMGLKDISSV